MAKGNRKVVFLTQSEAEKWYLISNLFAQSLLSSTEAIQEYNKLTVAQRKGIKKRISDFDSLRNRALVDEHSKEDLEHHYLISVLVDSHIVATEYDTDPIVVLMCVSPPCKLSQRVIVK